VLRSGAIIQSAVNSTVDIVLSGDPVVMPQATPTPDTITLAPDPYVRGLVSYKPMVEQNVIRLWQNTVLAVDKLTQFDTGVDTVSDTELDLRAGRIFFNVKKMSAAAQFIIKIPNGVAGIRGSYGFVDASGTMAMGEGSAVESIILNGKPLTEVINAGFQFDPSTGQLTPISHSVLEDFVFTRTSLITLFQAVGGPTDPDRNIINITKVYCSPGGPKLK
jgi:hypothetical protein